MGFVETAVGQSLVLSQSTLEVTEGEMTSYTVKLSEEPAGDVEVSIGGGAGTDLSLDPASLTLTFTASDWSMAQPVTVTDSGDTDATDDSSALTHTAGGYDPVTLSVTVRDTTRVDLSPRVSTSNFRERETASLQLRISQALSHDLTATVEVTPPAHGVVGDLDFSPSSRRWCMNRCKRAR